MTRHEDQEIKFLGREVNFVAAHADQPRLRIDQEIAGTDRFLRRFSCGRYATQVRPYSRQQFIHAERLGDVVVGAGIERLDFRFLLTTHREHDDRDGRAFADRAAKLHARHARHGEVGDNEVGQPVHCRVEAGFAVGCGFHFVALGVERSLEHARDLRFIIDHQNTAALAHDSLSCVTMWTSTAVAWASSRWMAVRYMYFLQP